MSSRRPGRDVEVRTPLLSLGIKGTSIEVAVDAEQNSVLVLEGRITATTPGEEPADLGPGEGLRQRAEPGSAPERLGIADLPPRVDRAGADALASAAAGSDLDRRGAVGSGADRVGRGGAGRGRAAIRPRCGSDRARRAPQPVGATAGSTIRPRCSRSC